MLLQNAKRYIASIIGMFPLTAQGCIALIVAAGALNVFAYGSLDLVVFALAICALTILVFCLFNTVIVGVVLQRRIRRMLSESKKSTNAIKVEAGFPNETGFALPTTNFIPLTRINWKIVFPDSIETRTDLIDSKTIRETIVPSRRCLTNRIVREFSVSDVLGFCRFTWYQEQDAELQALPQSHSIKQLPILRSLTAEDGIPNPSGEPEGDRMEIRPYAPGDSVKNIMWKVFARNRQLNVRLPENSVFHSNRTVAYLLSSPNDEAASAIARIAIESGALGEDWEFGADGTAESSNNIADALRAVSRSRALEDPYSYGLDDFLNRSTARGSAHCIVFAEAEQAKWLLPLKRTISHYSGQFSLILATDGMEEQLPASFWNKLTLRQAPVNNEIYGESGSLNRIKALLTEIGQLVESTLVVDRSTGISFDRNLRKV